MDGNLFNVQIQDCPSRSLYDNEKLKVAVVEKILPDIIKWLEFCSSENEVRKDLMNVISDDDGYYLAKRLDDGYHWEVDSELVEILDRVSFIILREHDKLVKEWVAFNVIKPKYNVGDKVLFHYHSHSYSSKVELIEGEITKIDGDTAKYLMFCGQLGHVKEGMGTHGIYVKFEDVV